MADWIFQGSPWYAHGAGRVHRRGGNLPPRRWSARVDGGAGAGV